MPDACAHPDTAALASSYTPSAWGPPGDPLRQPALLLCLTEAVPDGVLIEIGYARYAETARVKECMGNRAPYVARLYEPLSRPYPAGAPITVRSAVEMFEDGMPGIGTTSYTLSEMASKVEVALRTVPVRLGPNALAILREDGTVPLSGGEYAAMALAVATMLAGEEL
jgi:hypothetical protein